eukprot:1157644-Pelagomonas_calceolata.AAC.5
MHHFIVSGLMKFDSGVACLVGVFTPRPSCSNPISDLMSGFMEQNWLANLVSESGMVQWLGRYRRGVSRHGWPGMGGQAWVGPPHQKTRGAQAEQPNFININ